MKKKAPKKKIVRGYSDGTPSAGTETDTSGAQAGVDKAGALLIALSDTAAGLSKSNSTKTVLQDTGKMTATGASIGTMIAPGAGTLIGAGVGAVAGVTISTLKNKKRKEEERKARDKKRDEVWDMVSQLKRETTDEFSTKESKYNNATVGYDTVSGMPGGNFKFLAEGGEVNGPGTAKSDSIKTKVPNKSVIVPTENAGMAEALREMFLPKKEGKMKPGGDVNVKLSNGEHMFTPKEKAVIDKKLTVQGIEPMQIWDHLIPNPDAGNELKKGGTVKADTTGKGSVAMDRVVGPATHQFTKQQLLDIEDAKKVNWEKNRRLPKVHQPILMNNGGQAGGDDDIATLLKQLEEAEKKSSEASKRRAAVNKKAEELHNKSQKDKEDAIIRKGHNHSSQNLIKQKYSYIEKAKLRIKQGHPNEAKILLHKALDLTEKVEASFDPANYKRSAMGAYFSPDLYEENKKKSVVKPTVKTEEKKIVAPVSNPNSPLDPNKVQPTATLKPTKNTGTSKRTPKKAVAKVDTTVAPPATGLPSTLPRQDGGFYDFPEEKRTGPTVDDLKIATPSTSPTTATSLNQELFKEEDAKADVKSSMTAADILALGQTMAGLLSDPGRRPEDKPDPLLISRTAEAIANADKAEEQAKSGFSQSQRESLIQGIENTRRQTSASTVQTSAGSGSAGNALRFLSQDKNRSLIDVAAQDENLKLQKASRADSLNQHANAMVAGVDARKRQIFEDDKESYWKEAEATGELINSGLYNYFQSQERKTIEEMRRKRELANNPQ